MAITLEGDLYVWGEAKLGQCGTGKKKKSEIKPTLVKFNPEDTPKRENPTIKVNPLSYEVPDHVKVVTVSGGFGHTACITENGDLFTWGFNIKG